MCLCVCVLLKTFKAKSVKAPKGLFWPQKCEVLFILIIQESELEMKNLHLVCFPTANNWKYGAVFLAVFTNTADVNKPCRKHE